MGYLFYSVYEPNEVNSGTYQTTLSWIIYVIGKIVLVNQNKNDKNFSFMKKNIYSNTPIVKIFREYFIVENKETNANGKEKTVFNSILPIHDILKDDFSILLMFDKCVSNLELIKERLFLNEQLLVNKYYKYFDITTF